MAQSIDRRGISSVLEGFDTFETPYYAVLQGGQIKYYCDDEDMEGAKELLKDNLLAAHQAGSDALYQLRLYKRIPDDGVDLKTPYIGSFNFKVQDQPTPYYPYQQINQQSQPERITGTSAFEQMQSRIAALEDAKDVEPEPQKVGLLETFLQNPQMAVGAIAGILQIVKDFFNPHSQQSQQQPQVYELREGEVTDEEIRLINYWRGLDEKTKAFLKSQIKQDA